MPCLVGAGAVWSGVGTLASPLLKDYPLPPLLDRILNVLLASRRAQGNVLSSSKGCILKAIFSTPPQYPTPAANQRANNTETPSACSFW